MQVLNMFDTCIQQPKCKGIIIDSLTFLMDMFESKYVLTSANKMQAWSQYQEYFKSLLQDRVINFARPVIMLAHTLDTVDENGNTKTAVPIKGSLKNNSIEAYFSCIIGSKKIPLSKLDTPEYKNDMLHITSQDSAVGFKYVFQTMITRETVGERIRGPMGLWESNETYIDNDTQLVLDKLTEYYN